MLETAVGLDGRAGMRLANKNVDEIYLPAPVRMKFLERLDRAGGDRSAVGTEVEDRGPAA